MDDTDDWEESSVPAGWYPAHADGDIQDIDPELLLDFDEDNEPMGPPPAGADEIFLFAWAVFGLFVLGWAARLVRDAF